ncbi:MAG: hypothetical protein ACRD3N_18800 [Terracidiphilus sp.]
MRIAGKFDAVGAMLLLGAGLLLAGCQSEPPLTESQAQQMIQARYDQTAPAPITITVSDLGMRQGATSNLWDRTRVYPNGFWADFKLTPDGAKAVKLSGGGDVIEWRPDSPNDAQYSIVVTTVVANHLKALNVRNVQDEVLPGASKAEGADYDEGVNFTGVPAPLVTIASDPGNQLSTPRHADFTLVNGAWKLQSIE